jgi:hypothetical protein
MPAVRVVSAVVVDPVAAAGAAITPVVVAPLPVTVIDFPLTEVRTKAPLDPPPEKVATTPVLKETAFIATLTAV